MLWKGWGAWFRRDFGFRRSMALRCEGSVLNQGALCRSRVR